MKIEFDPSEPNFSNYYKPPLLLKRQGELVYVAGGMLRDWIFSKQIFLI